MTHPRAPFAALALLLAAPALAQPYPTLGHALFAQGYTRALYIPTENVAARRTAPFNPNAVLYADRYGHPTSAAKGNTVGERASCEVVAQYVAGGFVPGFTGPLACPGRDLDDVKMLTRSGTRAVYDDMLAAVGGPVVEPTPRPSPTPRPDPVATPSPTPSCPVCPAPPVLVPAQVPAGVVARLHATLAALDRLGALTSPLIKWGEGRRALVRDSRAAIAEVEALLGAWVAGLYRPVDDSTGSITTTVEGEQR